MYIKRYIEKTIIDASKNWKIILLIGARESGKTTLVKNLNNDNLRTYVNLSNLANRALAKEEPSLFLQRYQLPIIIDEIQFSPELFDYIINHIIKYIKNGDIWLISSQKLKFDSNEVKVIELQGLSLKEIKNVDYDKQFIPCKDNLLFAAKTLPKVSLKEIYKHIWKGSMPELNSVNNYDWQDYYAKYVQKLLCFDIIKLLQINDEIIYFKFLCAVAGQMGQIVNYAELAKAADISAPTAKQWVKILETVGIIYFLQPFIPKGAKYVVKASKIYFFDTGLAAYLMQWNNPEALEAGAKSNEFFTTWVIMEIYKSYANKGIIPRLYYLRNFNGKEIELIVYENHVVYPIAIKRSTKPDKFKKIFDILEPIKKDTGILLGERSIICFNEFLEERESKLLYIPVSLI